MNTKLNILIIVLLFASNTFSQEKETIEKNGIESYITISETGNYNGTKSLKANDYYNQASDYANKNDLNNAKKFYIKAIKEDPNFVEAYDNLGLVHRRLEDYDKAIEYYKASIELYPNGPMAHQNLATVYSIQTDYASAISEYEFLVEIAPNDPEGYFGLANSYMMLSKFDDALLNGNKALELYKETNSHHLGDGYYIVGLVHYYKGDKNKAKEYIELAKKNGAKVHPQVEKELK